eukprot:scaffold48448_cov36-Phaeocystis_antarctica.AAC.2
MGLQQAHGAGRFAMVPQMDGTAGPPRQTWRAAGWLSGTHTAVLPSGLHGGAARVTVLQRVSRVRSDRVPQQERGRPVTGPGRSRGAAVQFGTPSTHRVPQPGGPRSPCPSPLLGAPSETTRRARRRRHQSDESASAQGTRRCSSSPVPSIAERPRGPCGRDASRRIAPCAVSALQCRHEPEHGASFRSRLPSS